MWKESVWNRWICGNRETEELFGDNERTGEMVVRMQKLIVQKK